MRNDIDRLSLDGGTFEGILERSAGIRDMCNDWFIPNVNERTLRFNPDSTGIGYCPDPGTEWRERPVSRYSLGQLCTRLGIPVGYVDRCIETGRADLAADNINSWAMDFGKPMLVREYNGGVRGMLSEKYVRLDSAEVLEGLGKSVPVDDFDVRGWFLDETFLHVRLVGRKRLDAGGEDLFPGISLTTSDVGRSSLTVQFLVWKQVCTNGLILPKAFGEMFRQKHIGIDPSMFRQRLFDSFQDMELVFRAVEKRVSELAGSPVRVDTDDEVKRIVHHVRMHTGLSEDAGNRVVSLIRDGTYSPDRWGLINSVTQVAQDYTLLRRIEIEEAAGQMMLAA